MARKVPRIDQFALSFIFLFFTPGGDNRKNPQQKQETTPSKPLLKVYTSIYTDMAKM